MASSPKLPAAFEPVPVCARRDSGAAEPRPRREDDEVEELEGHRFLTGNRELRRPRMVSGSVEQAGTLRTLGTFARWDRRSENAQLCQPCQLPERDDPIYSRRRAGPSTVRSSVSLGRRALPGPGPRPAAGNNSLTFATSMFYQQDIAAPPLAPLHHRLHISDRNGTVGQGVNRSQSLPVIQIRLA